MGADRSKVPVSDINPAHYRVGGLEVIDIIDVFELGMHLGNAIKYILRAGRKGDSVTDIKKAVWYLNRWIDNQEKSRR